jgi:hypothetical protein
MAQEVLTSFFCKPSFRAGKTSIEVTNSTLIQRALILSRGECQKKICLTSLLCYGIDYELNSILNLSQSS